MAALAAVGGTSIAVGVATGSPRTGVAVTGRAAVAVGGVVGAGDGAV